LKKDLFLPKPVKSIRDILIFEFSSGEKLVVGCDSAGGIGPKTLDKVKVDGYTLGKFTARVTLMEVLATGAKPFCIIDTLSVELEPTGLEILEGIKEEAKIAGLDPKAAITGGSEKNFKVEQTGIGVTVIGLAKKKDLRIGISKPNNIIVAIGTPCVGIEVICAEKDHRIADLIDLQNLLNCKFINEIIPVGSEGIDYEIQVLAKCSNLKYELINQSELNLKKSAGPATVILASLDKSKLAELKTIIAKPVKIVAQLLE
jgi:hypothetical protein